MRKWTPFAVTNVVFVYNYMYYSPNQDTSLIRNPSSVSRVPESLLHIRGNREIDCYKESFLAFETHLQ